MCWGSDQPSPKGVSSMNLCQDLKVEAEDGIIEPRATGQEHLEGGTAYRWLVSGRSVTVFTVHHSRRRRSSPTTYFRSRRAEVRKRVRQALQITRRLVLYVSLK